MGKSKDNNDLFRKIASVKKEIEEHRTKARKKNKLLSESLELLRMEMQISRNRLAGVPKKDWVKKSDKGLTFIPLVLQTHKIIHDSITAINILKDRREPSAEKVKPFRIVDELPDEGMKKLINLLKNRN